MRDPASARKYRDIEMFFSLLWRRLVVVWTGFSVAGFVVLRRRKISGRCGFKAFFRIRPEGHRSGIASAVLDAWKENLHVLKDPVAAPGVIAEDDQEQIKPGGGLGGGEEEKEPSVFADGDGEVVAEVLHAHGQKGEQGDDAQLYRLSLCGRRFVAGVAASPVGEEGDIGGACQGDGVMRIGDGALGDHAAEIAQPVESPLRKVARKKNGNPCEKSEAAPPII